MAQQAVLKSRLSQAILSTDYEALGGGGSPAFCRCRVGRFAAMIAAKSGKFYTIFNIVFSLNKQVLPNIL